MSPTSCSAIRSSFALRLLALTPEGGRSSPSSGLMSSPQRSRFNTITGPDGTSAAKCCFVAITTFASPILPVRINVSRSSAYTLAPLLMGAT